MISLNCIYNEDCLSLMDKMDNNCVDVVLTSPPYNTGRNHGTMENYEKRYDIYLEERNNEEYIDWTIDIFNHYDKILKDNGCVLYNISYGNENADLLFILIGEIIKRTNFTIADTIIWKKKSALPNNVSANKLTRICEFVFVFCRKNEYNTFYTNKQIINHSKTGQPYYENIFNFFIANNNDEVCDLNKATFSTDFCKKLIDIYVPVNGVVYDSFMGTGTTAVACSSKDRNYIGSELSKAQCDWANKRLSCVQKSLF